MWWSFSSAPYYSFKAIFLPSSSIHLSASPVHTPVSADHWPLQPFRLCTPASCSIIKLRLDVSATLLLFFVTSAAFCPSVSVFDLCSCYLHVSTFAWISLYYIFFFYLVWIFLHWSSVFSPGNFTTQTSSTYEITIIKVCSEFLGNISVYMGGEKLKCLKLIVSKICRITSNNNTIYSVGWSLRLQV